MKKLLFLTTFSLHLCLHADTDEVFTEIILPHAKPDAWNV